MQKTPNLVGKISMVFSIVGCAGGFLVPIFGFIDSIYWGSIVSSITDFYLISIFFALSLIGVLLAIISLVLKEKQIFGIVALIFGGLGFLINGGLLFIGMISSVN